MGQNPTLYDLYFLNDIVIRGVNKKYIASFIGVTSYAIAPNKPKPILGVFRVYSLGVKPPPMYIESRKNKTAGIKVSSINETYNRAVITNENGFVIDSCDINDIVELLEDINLEY